MWEVAGFLRLLNPKLNFTGSWTGINQAIDRREISIQNLLTETPCGGTLDRIGRTGKYL